MRLLVIGGSDAGIAAALRARELDPSVEVTVVVADAFPNFSICGLPYFLSGDVSDWRDLAHRTTTDLEQAGIQLLLDHTARAIDPGAKQVTITNPGGGERQLGYDRLVVGTGAVPVRPPIDGLDLDGVHVLHTMADTFALHQALAGDTRSAVIVGGGYIGLEMAEAFTARGLSVTLIEQAPAVMPTVDVELGQLLGEELGRHGVQVVNDVIVKAISCDAGQLTVAGEPDFAATADVVLVVVGVRPDTDLAVAAGVETGVRGAIRVDRRMRTNLADLLAAGDCVETYHRLLDAPAYLPLGTTAHKQGRVAGETAVGGDREFAGSLGTQVVKVFDLAVARTGLRDEEATAAGFDPLTVGSVQLDHKAYYPGAHRLHLRITGDRASGRLLGAQLVGHHDAEVAKRIDTPANALFHGRTVDGLNDLDLSYTPPFGSPWDAIQLAAQTWTPARRQASFARDKSMKLRLLPRQEDAYFGLFEAAADNVVVAAKALLDLLSDPADAETKAKHLLDLEHEGDRITREILTRLATTFIARFDRDEIYALANGLDDVTDTIEEVGGLVFLHGISQPLQAVVEQTKVLVRAAEQTADGMRGLRQLDPEHLALYTNAIDVLEREGDQLYRRMRATLYDFTGEHPAQHVLRWLDITSGVEDALDQLERVAYTVEGIMLKHA